MSNLVTGLAEDYHAFSGVYREPWNRASRGGGSDGAQSLAIANGPQPKSGRDDRGKTGDLLTLETCRRTASIIALPLAPLVNTANLRFSSNP